MLQEGSKENSLGAECWKRLCLFQEKGREPGTAFDFHNHVKLGWKGINIPIRQMRKWRLRRSEETSPRVDDLPQVEHRFPACFAAKINDNNILTF